MDKNPINQVKRISNKLNLVLRNCSFGCPGEEDDETPVVTLTSFTANLDGDPCFLDAMTFPTTLYHNGEEEYPLVGDTIYSDAAGTMPLTFENFQTSLPSGVVTDGNGVSSNFSCL